MKTVANFLRWLADKIDKPVQFTSSTTWYVPREWRELKIMCSGGGGGGGDFPGAAAGCGGGGGDPICVKTKRKRSKK